VLAASAATGNLVVLLALRWWSVSPAGGFIGGRWVGRAGAHGSSGTASSALIGLYLAGGGAGIVVSAASCRRWWITAVSLAGGLVGAGRGPLLALGAAVPAALRCPEVHPAPSRPRARLAGAGLHALVHRLRFFGAGYIA